MKHELSCGAEVPLGPNAHLLSLDEASSTVRVWAETLEGAFRHSFVPMSEGSCLHVGRSLLAQYHSRQLSSFWIVGWEHVTSGPGSTRSRFIRSELELSGWTVALQDGVALAERAIHADDVPVSPPESCRRELQGFLISSGQSSPLRALAAPPFESTMRHFCRIQRLQPSREFAAGLLKEKLIVAYLSTASDVRHGLVVLGPQVLAPDVSRLQSEGAVTKVLRNADAPLAWQGLAE